MQQTPVAQTVPFAAFIPPHAPPPLHAGRRHSPAGSGQSPGARHSTQVFVAEQSGVGARQSAASMQSTHAPARVQTPTPIAQGSPSGTAPAPHTPRSHTGASQGAVGVQSPGTTH